MTQQIQLPQEATDLLKRINEKHSSVTMAELSQSLLKRFNTEAIQRMTDMSQEQKFVFCAKILKGQYDNLIPYDSYDVVTVGIGPVQINKQGGKRGEVHVWRREGNNDVLKAITFTDNDTEKLKTIQMFSLYKNVKLGKYASGDFSSDDRSIFENPVQVDMPRLDIFAKLNINRCKISEVLSNLAKLSGKYAVNTDYRIIRGIVVDYKKGVNQDTGKEWAWYKIHDSSMDEDFTSPDGTVVKTILTVWVNPMWMVYEKDNEIDFLGPLTVYDKQVSMTAYCLIPVHTPYGKQGA